MTTLAIRASLVCKAKEPSRTGWQHNSVEAYGDRTVYLDAGMTHIFVCVPPPPNSRPPSDRAQTLCNDETEEVHQRYLTMIFAQTTEIPLLH